jgi:hypothetical protein
MMPARSLPPNAKVERERALVYVCEAVADREQADRSLWTAAAFARRCGVTWPQLAAAVDCSVETVRRRVREIEGCAA